MKIKKVHVLAPCYNEGEGVIIFLNDLCANLMEQNFQQVVDIYIIDDGSTDNTYQLLQNWKSPNSKFHLNILSVGKNLGHQQAIRNGLIYLAGVEDVQVVIVMDSDGEDDPSAIPELIEKYNGQDVIFVNRGKRKENFLFRISYFFYKMLFRFVTGNTIGFGNFCLLNKKLVKQIATEDFIHFAADLSKRRVQKSYITKDRRKRLFGESKMRYSSLLNHGFNSLIVYSEELIFLFLKFSVFMILMCVGMVSYILYHKIFTDKAILGWASTLTIGFFNSFLISLGFFVIGLLLLKIRYLSKIPLEKNNIHCESVT